VSVSRREGVRTRGRIAANGPAGAFSECSDERHQTCRESTEQLGEVGIRFLAFASNSRLIDVRNVALGLVAAYLYRPEGFASKEDFIESWCEQHPEIGYQPARTVYVHLFVKAGAAQRKRLVSDACKRSTAWWYSSDLMVLAASRPLTLSSSLASLRIPCSMASIARSPA